MHLVINELSFSGQAQHDEHVSALMRTLAKVIQALELRRGNSSLYAHSLLWQQRISANLSLHDWINGGYHRELQPIRLLLLKLLRNGPHIDVLLTPIDHQCECEQEGVRISIPKSGIAGAIRFGACLVGLDECLSFPDGIITVHYCENNTEFKSHSIHHICTIEGTKRLVRTFEPHPKHDQDFPTYGVRGTPMDLKPEEATRVLNIGEELVENDRRIYAYYNRKVYVFHPHRQQQNLYHGFPVEPRELMRDNIHAYNAIRKKGWTS